MIGVPSIASSALTRRLVGPSSAVTVTRWTPIGFGRSGERVLKTPGEWEVRVPGRVGLEDVSVGEVEPGEQDEVVADADPM
jgi:hypothetical protein